jgi:hypothetical protein
MARILCVTLSIEWQCEQLACAKALPAIGFGSALHGVPATNALKATTIDDTTVLLNRCMQVPLKPIQQHWVADGAEGGERTGYARAAGARWELKCTEMEMITAASFHIRCDVR